MQLDEVDAVALEDRGAAQVEPRHFELCELVGDGGRRPGEEAGLEAAGGGAEAQVEAGGLVLVLAYGRERVDASGGCEIAQVLYGQHAGSGLVAHGTGLSMGQGAWPAAKRSIAAIASAGVMRSRA